MTSFAILLVLVQVFLVINCTETCPNWPVGNCPALTTGTPYKIKPSTVPANIATNFLNYVATFHDNSVYNQFWTLQETQPGSGIFHITQPVPNSKDILCFTQIGPYGNPLAYDVAALTCLAEANNWTAQQWQIRCVGEGLWNIQAVSNKLHLQIGANSPDFFPTFLARRDPTNPLQQWIFSTS